MNEETRFQKTQLMAYYLWLEDGAPPGNDGTYYWFKAEEKLYGNTPALTSRRKTEERVAAKASTRK